MGSTNPSKCIQSRELCFHDNYISIITIIYYYKTNQSLGWQRSSAEPNPLSLLMRPDCSTFSTRFLFLRNYHRKYLRCCVLLYHNSPHSFRAPDPPVVDLQTSSSSPLVAFQSQSRAGKDDCLLMMQMQSHRKTEGRVFGDVGVPGFDPGVRAQYNN